MRLTDKSPDYLYQVFQFYLGSLRGQMNYNLIPSYILANDPDADRLACAQKTEDGWRVFNGNELGALLGHWLVSQHLSSQSSKSKSNLHLLASTVSSKFLDTLARAEGLTFTETLTGFKHMGNVSDKLIHRGEH